MVWIEILTSFLWYNPPRSHHSRSGVDWNKERIKKHNKRNCHHSRSGVDWNFSNAIQLIKSAGHHSRSGVDWNPCKVGDIVWRVHVTTLVVVWIEIRNTFYRRYLRLCHHSRSGVDWNHGLNYLCHLSDCHHSRSGVDWNNGIVDILKNFVVTTLVVVWIEINWVEQRTYTLLRHHSRSGVDWNQNVVRRIWRIAVTTLVVVWIEINYTEKEYVSPIVTTLVVVWIEIITNECSIMISWLSPLS